MLRLTAFAFCLGLAAPAAAFDISNMTPAERESFRAEIADYLLDNPEILMEAIAVLEQRRAEIAANQEDQLLVDYQQAIFDDGHSWVGGNPEGDITIVEFLDYQCGFCKRAFPVMEDIITNDGNIRFIVKEFPILGDASVLGSRYALATRMVEGDDAYKAVHDRFMQLRGALSGATIARVANDLGLDHDAITARMDDPEIDRMIAENRQLAQTLQIQGTPTFIVENQFVRGLLEGPQMVALIEQIRAEKQDG